MGKSRRVRGGAVDVGVIEWIRRASPDEISDALLAVDEEKAALVVIELAKKSEGEIKRLLDGFGKEFDSDPVGTVAKSFFGTLSRIGRGG